MTIDPSVSTGARARWAEPVLSWPAIIAGAVVSLAASILLTLAAAGLGYAVAPSGLADRGALGAFTPALGAGAIAVQVLCGALGGYLAGRLRTMWSDLHDHEAHFRDTAHGLIAWALSTVAGVVLAATVLGPYAEHLASPALSAASASLTSAQAERAVHIAEQSAFFMAVGLLLSAFTACVAGRLGGMAAEGMHARARS